MSENVYPWFAIVQGDSLEQGDILRHCPAFTPPGDLDLTMQNLSSSSVQFQVRHYDVIVMSQTCDLIKGREKVDQVLLCSLHAREDFDEKTALGKVEGWENARKGRFPAYHVINKCDLSGHESAPRMVSFYQVFSLPMESLRNLAEHAGERLRLLPPYREHLSQAFARFFMRIGLPADIPPFK
jgi:hypothetical protein